MTDKTRLPNELLEEYKMCQEKASGLADNIWKTAAIFGFASFAGIVGLASTDAIPDNLSPWLSIIVSLFAIALLLTWRRLSRRWLSIEETMFRRMEHIERQSQFRANLYVRYLNGAVQFASEKEFASLNQPYLQPDLIKDLNKIQCNYERRGIRPMIRFVIELNIWSWVAFCMLQCATLLPSTQVLNLSGLVKLIITVVFVGVFVWRLLAHCFQD